MKKSEAAQKAAYEAHKRSEKALKDGDATETIKQMEKSRDKAIEAMLLRMRGK